MRGFRKAQLILSEFLLRIYLTSKYTRAILELLKNRLESGWFLGTGPNSKNVAALRPEWLSGVYV